MAGYSGTPLPKKLGMLPGTTVFFDGGALDIPSITRATRLDKDVDIVHLFTKSAGGAFQETRQLPQAPARRRGGVGVVAEEDVEGLP